MLTNMLICSLLLLSKLKIPMFYVIYFYSNIVPGLLKYLVIGYDEKEQSLYNG